MPTEKEWVETLKPFLGAGLAGHGEEGLMPLVCSSRKLTYAHEILEYSGDDDQPIREARKYETDLLVYDEKPGGEWIPRVVLECKFGAVTTHDALTYSAKAATHKHVHPYLRYGILIGAIGNSLPGRLIRHGAYFDFMIVLEDESPTSEEAAILTQLLVDELKASRWLYDALRETRSRDRKRIRVFHRRLSLSESKALPAELANED